MSYQALGFTPQNAPRSVVAPPTSRQAVDAMSPEDEDPKLTSILVDLKWYESTSRTIDASQMPGVLAPVSVPGENFWDPFGLTTSISDNQLRWYRAAEIKHGRVCMLAFTGWFYQSVCHLTLAGPVSLSEGVSFQDLDKLKFYDQVACRAEDCPVCDDFSSRRTVTVTAPPQSRASQQRRGSPPSHHQPPPVVSPSPYLPHHHRRLLARSPVGRHATMGPLADPLCDCGARVLRGEPHAALRLWQPRGLPGVLAV